MSDLAKMLAENQKEVLKLIAPLNKKRLARLNDQGFDSEPEYISVARTSTLVKPNMAVPKTTPVNSRNMLTGVLNDSTTNQPTKRPKQQRAPNEQPRERPSTSEKCCSRLSRKLSHPPT